MKVFVSMPFRQPFDKVYEVIERAAVENKMDAYLVSQEHAARPIPELIENKIRESIIFIADITGNNPNVQYETGLATALKKPMIFISQECPENAPFDIKDRMIIRYSLEDLAGLEQALQAALNSPNEKLRSMLVPESLGNPEQHRFVIAVSPLSYRRAMGKSKGIKKFIGTASDFYGLRGILQAFGMLYGFKTLPEIIDPEDYAEGVIESPMTLYSIASPKTNRWTGALLKELSKNWAPDIGFKADPGSPDLKNVMVSLYKDNSLLYPSGYVPDSEGDRVKYDFGIIVRGPNPYHDDEMMVTIAGRSSLGTEAACRALTDVEIIGEIRERLNGMKVSLENHRQPFWALVSMKRKPEEGSEETLPQSLQVEQVDIFKPA